MSTDTVISISDEIAKPCDVPRSGDRRLVRLLPTPFGSRPAIWTSPYEVMAVLGEGEPPERCRVCILLMSAGSHAERPDVIVVTIPEAAIDKFPQVPVAW